MSDYGSGPPGPYQQPGPEQHGAPPGAPQSMGPPAMEPPPAGPPPPMTGPLGGPGMPPPPPRQSMSPGSVAIIAVVIVVVIGVLGGGIAYLVTSDSDDDSNESQGGGGGTGEPIQGLVDYHAEGAAWVDEAQHETGTIEYEVTPPAGGPHNGQWQECTGVVYTEQIPSEHAVHSLEHGAVWITYNPDLIDQAGIDALTARVQGQDYTFLSPFPEQDTAVSLQAWGYQLKVDDATDSRIDQFITDYRINASREPGAPCSNGVTVTGTTPLDL